MRRLKPSRHRNSYDPLTHTTHIIHQNEIDSARGTSQSSIKKNSIGQINASAIRLTISIDGTLRPDSILTIPRYGIPEIVDNSFLERRRRLRAIAIWWPLNHSGSCGYCFMLFTKINSDCHPVGQSLPQDRSARNYTTSLHDKTSTQIARPHSI